MAYSEPATRSSNEFLDQDDWNADVVDTRAFCYDRPAVKVTRTSAQSITTSTFTDIEFDNESYDTDGMHSTAGTTNRLTVQTAGVYAIYGHARFAAASGTSTRWLAINLNGGTYIAADFHSIVNQKTDMSVSAIYKLSASDYVTLEVWQNSGGTVDIEYIGSQPPQFGMTWLGAGTA